MKQTRIGSVLLFLILGIIGGLAQDDPPPTTTYVIDWQADVLFPSAIAFRLVVEPPSGADVSTLSLTLDIPQRNTRTFPITFGDSSASNQDITRTGRTLIVDYFWVFSAADVPPMFEAITYRWDLTLSNGETDTVTDGEVIFQDGRYTWAVASDEALPLRLAVPADAYDPARVISSLFSPYDLLAMNTAPLNTTYRAVLYPRGYTLACEQDADGNPIVSSPRYDRDFPCDINLARELYVRNGWLIYDTEAGGVSGAQVTLTDLLFEEMYGRYWTGGDIPAWFQAGVRLLYDDLTIRPALLDSARAVIRSNLAYSLAGMDAASPAETDPDYTLWLGQAYGMVLYMADRFGVDAVFTLARDVGDYANFAAAYEAVMGEPIAALIPDWQLWVFSERAEPVFNVSLYGPPTPTPTPFLTATPRPPTQAPPPTAIPSETPTNLPTFPPPTLTPVLPTMEATAVVAAPLITPTVMVVDTFSAGFDDNQQVIQLVLYGVVALAALLIAVGVVVGQRRRR